jgi:hypothetical protein
VLEGQLGNKWAVSTPGQRSGCALHGLPEHLLLLSQRPEGGQEGLVSDWESSACTKAITGPVPWFAMSWSTKAWLMRYQRRRRGRDVGEGARRSAIFRQAGRPPCRWSTSPSGA